MQKFFNRRMIAFLALSQIFWIEPTFAAIYRPTDASSLIQAVKDANTSPENDIIDLQGRLIEFDSDCNEEAGSCTAVSALPDIEAAGGKLSIINGTLRRQFGATDNFRLIEVLVGADLTLFNVTLVNGSADGFSGLALSSNSLPGNISILENISDNGGAIYNSGNLSLHNCALLSNFANDQGGAIYNDESAVLIIHRSNLSGNTATNSGGAIFNADDGIIEVINETTIAGNSATNGGGIINLGSVNYLMNSTISNNTSSGSGAGIYNDSLATTLRLYNSTIANNIAVGHGGGIFNGGSSVLINDDIPPPSPGVYIYNSTIAYNQANDVNSLGGGVYNDETVPAVIDEIFSTIIALNIDGEGATAPDFYDGMVDNVTSESHNLIGNSGGNYFLLGNNFDVVDVDPKLGSLADNGGFTFTIALLPQSLAINQGLNPLSLFFDQRGPSYSRVKCSRPDIGAYERQNCR